MKSGWHAEWDAYCATGEARARIASMVRAVAVFGRQVHEHFVHLHAAVRTTQAQLAELAEKLEEPR